MDSDFGTYVIGVCLSFLFFIILVICFYFSNIYWKFFVSLFFLSFSLLLDCNYFKLVEYLMC